jgi:zinc protease
MNAHALDVERSVLDNGLTLLHAENHTLPIVTVTLIVKAGQTREPEKKAGLAHLTAELLTEGTKNRTAKAISEEIDFIGASLDASAGNDYTTVSLSVLKKDVEKGFEVCAEILQQPIFPEEEIKRKKDQVKGFLQKLEEEPDFLAARAFKQSIFGSHPYSRVLQGTVNSIDAVKRDDVVSFHEKYFIPNNAILSVVGDLTQKELSALIDKYYSHWEKGSPPPGASRLKGSVQGAQVIKIDKNLTQANILMGKRGVRRENPDYYKLSVMNYILGGGGLSSRLMQSVRDDMGLAYDIRSSFAAMKEGGSFQVTAQTKNESARTVIEEVYKQVNSMRTEHVTEQELSDAKSFLIGSFQRRLDTNRKITDFLALVEFYELGLDYIEKYPEYIGAVTKDDILHAARKYLDPDQFVLVVVADQEKTALDH